MIHYSPESSINSPTANLILKLIFSAIFHSLPYEHDAMNVLLLKFRATNHILKNNNKKGVQFMILMTICYFITVTFFNQNFLDYKTKKNSENIKT